MILKHRTPVDRPWRLGRALWATVLLSVVLLGMTACGALPYTGPPDPSTGESEHGKGG